MKSLSDSSCVSATESKSEAQSALGLLNQVIETLENYDVYKRYGTHEQVLAEAVESLRAVSSMLCRQ